MSRIIKVDGTRLDFREGSSLVAEYDVPVDAWYLRDNSFPDIPISVWMEIALQPCGMLLAHLSPILLHPQQEYIFRNLDGEARLLDRMDVRAKTITTRVVLLKTIISGNMFIHTLSFALNCGGVPLFEGSSTFGFFPPESLAVQTGLDGGKETVPLLLIPGGSGLEGEAVKASYFRLVPVGNPFRRLPEGKMDLIEDAFFASQGGRYGKGYIFARRTNDPSSWFYRNHFFQDPVMPGSLGVEAIYQSMQAYLLNRIMGKNMVMPRFDLVNRETLVWKYRGQILPVTKEMQLEAHIVDLHETQDGVVLIADASLWGDSIRIYDVKRAAIRLVEG
jgi:3-hydroxymyristoyl/3-hydroxydecanoyl-(acyl carrier protein) dehydratase